MSLIGPRPDPPDWLEKYPEDVKVFLNVKPGITGCDAVNAIGIQNGPSHTEIKVTKDGPKVVELGARLGGDNITTHLVPLSTGVNLVECCIHVALGETPDFNSKIKKASAIRYLKTEFGVISAINGIR